MRRPVFGGVGAYITANMVLKLGLGSAAAFIIATTGTAAFAFILGFAFFRLKQYYFTFASVGLMTILNGLFMNWVPVTGGALGISDIPVFSIAGFAANTENRKFFFDTDCLHAGQSGYQNPVSFPSGTVIHGHT